MSRDVARMAVCSQWIVSSEENMSPEGDDAASEGAVDDASVDDMQLHVSAWGSHVENVFSSLFIFKGHQLCFGLCQQFCLPACTAQKHAAQFGKYVEGSHENCADT